VIWICCSGVPVTAISICRFASLVNLHKSFLSHSLATYIFTCKSAKTGEATNIVSGHTTAGRAKKKILLETKRERERESVVVVVGGGVAALYSWLDA
jgi:predicted TIM-barrel enzyme